MHLYLDIENIPRRLSGLRDVIAAKILPPATSAKKKPELADEAFRKASVDCGMVASSRSPMSFRMARSMASAPG